MYVAVVMKVLLEIVLTMDGESIIVDTMKMHQLSAIVSATISLQLIIFPFFLLIFAITCFFPWPYFLDSMVGLYPTIENIFKGCNQ